VIESAEWQEQQLDGVTSNGLLSPLDWRDPHGPSIRSNKASSSSTKAPRSSSANHAQRTVSVPDSS
jgi:hypothetical protein